MRPLFSSPRQRSSSDLRDLKAGLRDDRLWVRRQTAVYLAGEPAFAIEMPVQLAEALSDPDPVVRQNVASALGLAGPTAVEPLIKALKGKFPIAREWAAMLLGRMGFLADRAIGPLRKALKDPSYVVRGAAQQSLRRLGVDGISMDEPPPPVLKPRPKKGRPPIDIAPKFEARDRPGDTSRTIRRRRMNASRWRENPKDPD